MSWDDIRRKVLRRIKPSERDDRKVRKIADELVDRLNRASPDDIKVMLTGSFAKGTYIKGDLDFDIFVLFPHTYELKALQEMTFEWAKRFLEDWEIAYAQHPYIRGRYKGFEVDIVPSYIMKEGDRIRSAVDRTQLHTKYILENMSDYQKDEVRILKKFLKRLGVYGAEIRVNGFSGYLCELLILKYGTFIDLVKAAREWRFPVTIDLRGRMSHGVMKTLFPDHPLVVIDPVDKTRNVAAPVSLNSLGRFMVASHVFLREPSESFFFEEFKPYTVREMREELKGRGTHIILFEFGQPPRSEDVLWGEIQKTLRSMVRIFDEHGFNVIHSTPVVHDGRCFLILELESEVIPKVFIHKGPPVQLGAHVDKYISKEEECYDFFVDRGRLCSVRKRRVWKASEVVRLIMADPQRFGVSRGLLDHVRGARVRQGLRAVCRDTRYPMSVHLNRRFFLGF